MDRMVVGWACHGVHFVTEEFKGPLKPPDGNLQKLAKAAIYGLVPFV